jgi:peptidoglycan glycosyltransferase
MRDPNLWEEDVKGGISQPSKKFRNKEFARVTWFFVALFLFMMGFLVYFNVAEAGEFLASPYNRRADLFAERIIRGSIVDRNGNVLAETRFREDGSFYRAYPYGAVFAHVVGFDSRIVGNSGLEQAENSSLLTSNAFFLDQIMNEINGERNQGDTLVTTLDVGLQTAAYHALGGNRGAIIVMEASTGNILAMVSNPGFDPNTVEQAWDTLNVDDVNSPLLNRVTQGLYAPGSTFKTITTLAYIRQADPFAFHFECTGSYQGDGMVIPCFGGRAHGMIDLRSAFAISCNSVYANLGAIIDPVLFRGTADDLMFNQEIPSVMYHSTSSFTVDEHSGIAERMATGIGQGDTMVSPYHMTLITAAIANGGILMEPYLVYSVQNASGTVVRRNLPGNYRTLMSAEEASILRDYMEAVVTEGTGGDMAWQNFTVAGKTGTAEFGAQEEGRVHSWFTGFTNVDNPELVITVVVEGVDGRDGIRAVPMALQVLQAYYN